MSIHALLNFINAFVQATLDDPVWIHLPCGLNSSCPGRTCLRLVYRSLHGLSISPKVWYDHHFSFLTKDGFKQKYVDKCLPYERHIDDMGIATKNKFKISLYDNSKACKGRIWIVLLTKFLWILCYKVCEGSSGKTITLAQRVLNKKFIDATCMSNCNPKWTPTSTQLALGSDPGWWRRNIRIIELVRAHLVLLECSFILPPKPVLILHLQSAKFPDSITHQSKTMLQQSRLLSIAHLIKVLLFVQLEHCSLIAMWMLTSLGYMDVNLFEIQRACGKGEATSSCLGT